ncbi:sensor histidine kinase [Streptomyces sp. NBC_00122]|uniref:sensor histidine kinase n=1 Tax=Streptomyces sp. NBC_00122 TaxID=2903623 RepID=UPI003255500B
MTTPHPPAAPAPPLLQRLPRAARAALATCAVAATALLLYAALGSAPVPGDPAGEGAVLAAASLVVAAPLAWARRWPVAVLGTLLVEAVTASALRLRAEQTWPLLAATVLLVAAVAAARPARTALVAALAALAVQETVLQVDFHRDGGWSRVLAPGFLGLTACLALLVLLAWPAGTYVHQRRAYDEALRAHAAEQAVTAERLRIARELHDMVAHGIGVVSIQAGAARRVLDSEPEQARDALTAIESTGRETLRGLRTMLDILRRTDQEPSSEGPEAALGAEPFAGLGDLDRLVAATARAGVRVGLRRTGPSVDDLPEAVDRSAFRIVQESVTIGRKPHELSVEILDEGGAAKSGTDAGAYTSGYGIQGMRERVALLHGAFHAGPREGGGFRVAARFPLDVDPTKGDEAT